MAMRIELTGPADEVLSDLTRLREFATFAVDAGPTPRVVITGAAEEDELIASPHTVAAHEECEYSACEIVTRLDAFVSAGEKAREDLATTVSEVERLRKEVANAEVLKRVDTALIEGLQEARAGAIKASTEWRDQTIELGAKIARLETDKADILHAVAGLGLRSKLLCECGRSQAVCLGIYSGTPTLGCDFCCDHDGRDGWCVRLPDLETEEIQDSSAAGLSGGSSPRPASGSAAEGVVSPASSGQEAVHGAEAERGKDRALPAGSVWEQARRPERGDADESRGLLPHAAEGGDHHVDPAGGSDRGESAGRRQHGGPLGVRAEFGVAGPAARNLVQRDPEAGALELAPEGLTEEDDTFYAQAVSYVRSLAYVSTSLLQRQIFSGYNRTAKIMARLESEGIVGPPNGAGLREVLGAQKATAPEGAVGSADTTPKGKPPTEDSIVAEAPKERKEPTDQAAQNGPGQPINDSSEPSAGEKAAETRTAAPEMSEGTTSDHGAPVAGEAGPALQPLQWGRVTEKEPWHLWRGQDAGEAECGEATDATLTLLAEGKKPPPDLACLDCADLSGWTEPTELSRLPVEPQAEFALPKAVQEKKSTCFCGSVTFIGRQKKVVDPKGWHARAECAPSAGLIGYVEHVGDSENCLAPECENKGLGKLADAVCGLHQAAPESVRIEWYFQRYPERKPKPTAPPAKKLLPKKVGHG